MSDLLPYEAQRMLMQAELSAYLLWAQMKPSTLVQVILTILTDDLRVASTAVAARFLEATAGSDLESDVELSPREQAILEQLALGMTREQISAALPLPLRTVERTIATLEARFAVATTFMLGLKLGQLGMLL